MQNANVYKFTISRLGKKLPKEGEIYAADEGCLGDGEVLGRFCRIDVLDDDDCIDEQFYADKSGRWDLDDATEIVATKDFGKKLRGYEVDDVCNILYIDNEASYDLNDENWSMVLDGRVNFEDLDPRRVPGALAVCVQPYYNATAELNSSDVYGVKVDGDPSDEHNFSGVFLAPDPDELDELLSSAEDAGDFLAICNQWPDPELPQVKEAFLRAKANVATADYVWWNIDLARVALTVFRDQEDAKKIITETEKQIVAGHFKNRSCAYGQLAGLLPQYKAGISASWREDTVRLLHSASECVADVEDIEKIISVAGDCYLLDDKALAQQLFENAVSAATDSKLKAKLKRVGKSAIENLY